MYKKIIKSIFKNSIASITLQVITMAFGFILPKFILDTYGSTLNGLVSSITQATIYLTLIEAGLSTVTIQALFKPLSENNWKGINIILSTSKRFYIKIGYIFSALIILLAFIIPQFVKGQVSNKIAFQLTIIIGLGYVIEYFFYSPYKSLLISDQKQYVIVVIQSIGTIITKVIQLFIAIKGYDIRWIYIVPLLIFVLRILAIRIYIRFTYKNANFGEKCEKDVLSKRNNALIHQIAGMVVTNTDNVVLMIFTNLKVVSLYSIYNMIFSSIDQLISMVVSQAFLPGFGIILSKDDVTLSQKVYDFYEFIFSIISMIIFSITAVMIIPFISIYTKGIHDINYVNYKLAFLFLIVAILNNIRMPGVTTINAKGHFKETQYRAIIEAIINIVISLILVKKLGIYGVLLGTIISFSYRTFDIIIYTNKKILGQGYYKSLVRASRVVIFSIISFYVSYKMNIQLVEWSQWIIFATIYGIIISIISIFVSIVFELKTYRSLKKYIFNVKREIIS